MKKFVTVIASIVAASIAMLGFIIVMGQIFGAGGMSKAIIKGVAIIVGLAVFMGIREAIRHSWGE